MSIARTIKTSILAFVSVMFFGQAAMADHCLERASNSDLLNELSRRLGGSGGGESEAAQVDFSCNGSVLIVSHISSRGTESSMSLDVIYSSTCANFAAALAPRGGRVTAVRVAAVCQGSVLHRYSLTPDLLTELATRDLTYQSSCEAEMKRINGTI